MNRTDAEEYTEALGQVVSGGWRQLALGIKLGVPKALGLSREEWLHDLGGGARPPIEERKKAAAELTAPEEDGGFGLSQRAAAAVLGVDVATVNRDVAFATPGSEEQEPSGSDVANATPAQAGGRRGLSPEEVSEILAPRARTRSEAERYALDLWEEASLCLCRLAVITERGVDEMARHSTCADAVLARQWLGQIEPLLLLLDGRKEQQ